MSDFEYLARAEKRAQKIETIAEHVTLWIICALVICCAVTVEPRDDYTPATTETVTHE